MKVLLDENFPLGLVRVLRDAGLEVDHIITLGWRGASDERIRQFLSDRELMFLTLSNLDRATSRVTNRFTSVDLLPAYFIPDIRKYRSGDRSIYPMHFGSAGIPANFSSTWIAKTFVPAITTMVGVQAPQPNITSVAEFVRLLIGVVVDSLRITRQPATVNRPIETLVLFPERRSAFSARY